ncbi:hypothetical protein J2X97_003541 [Epilithonimonas hungarica]|uniref:hypothetical protein n=1 Tax=Epilithonimonas hungarica TaxID=454006 RepID=UPI00278208DE|nr:hypothetical protein [Epilithonimonas hungarica]MDP9957869.1 hypothetical protein [Epilithonimonas hungarica]
MKNVNIMMKKGFFVTAVVAANFIFGQVGINNEDPKATLDVTAKTTDGTKPEGFIAPRLSGEEIKGKDAKYLTEQKGTIIYATSASSDAGVSGAKTINITAEGYYYFDGSIWQKFNSGTAAGTEPWYNVATNTGATANTQDIYQMGKVGVGFKTPLYNFEIGDNLNNGSYLSLSQSGANANGQSSLTYFTKRDNSNSITNATSKGWKWFALSDTYTLNPALANSLFLEGWNNGVRTQNIMTANPNGNVGFGIQLPTAKVHINTPAIGTGFRLEDGSQGDTKVLMSDANGNGSWKIPASIKPIVIGTFDNMSISSDGGGSRKYTGMHITLTQGKWIINSGITVSMQTSTPRFWLHANLSSSSVSSTEQNGFIFLGPAGNNTGNASSIGPTTSNLDDNFGFVIGSTVINVTSPSVTFYYWLENKPSNYWLYSSGNYENYLYAIPQN